MRMRIDLISKKYATAFLNLYFEQINDQTIETLFQLGKFLSNNKLLYVYLRVPTISHLIKQKVLNKIAQSLNLSEPIIKVMFVLLEQGRIEILDKVIDQIVFMYRRRKNIRLFFIQSSHPLAKEEEDKIINFVKYVSKGDIITKFEVNEKLICGLGIRSKNFLWERSIAKKFRDVKQSIFRQVEL